MSVVRRRQTEMPNRWLAWTVDDVLASSEEFDDAQRHVGEMFWIGGPSANQPGFERGCIGLWRQAVAALGRQGHDAVPAFRLADDSTDRGHPLRLEEPRRGAVCGDHQVLDQASGAIVMNDL